jgi:hypothetical protein
MSQPKEAPLDYFTKEEFLEMVRIVDRKMKRKAKRD